MRPWLKVVCGCLAFASLVAIGSSPAAADVTDDTGGNNAGGQYSAWAYYARTTGGGNVSTPQPCTLEYLPDQPAFYEYNVVSRDGGQTYIVYYDCVAVGEILEDAEGLFPDNYQTWDMIDSWVVTPADPQDMINEAIARLNPVPPTIVTDPGGGIPGLVGITTYLSFSEPLGRQTASISDGPITVEVWADPIGDVEWDTGDRLPACNAPSGSQGECAHIYSRSSVDGGALDHGLPAYQITALINYQGGYAVYANGANVGGEDDIGDLQRTSETFLAVNEAQAINTGSGGG
jgi:hypothetical protein